MTLQRLELLMSLLSVAEWASHFFAIDVIALLYVAFCCFFYLIFKAYSLRRSCIEKCIMKIWRCKSFTLNKTLASCRFTHSKLFLGVVTAVFLFFDVSPFCILCGYVGIDSCGKLFVAWKRYMWKRPLLID